MLFTKITTIYTINKLYKVKKINYGRTNKRITWSLY